MDEKIHQVLKEIKEELQDIRSILELNELNTKFVPEDSNGKHLNDGKSMKCKF